MPRRKTKRGVVNATAHQEETEPNVIGVVTPNSVTVENLTLFKQCVTFVSAKSHRTVTLRPKESIVIEGVERANLQYYITNNILKVNAHGSL